MKIPLILLTLFSAFSVFGQSDSVTVIAPNQIIEREIKLKDTHLYSFTLNAGEFVRFDIGQKNVDPVLTIANAGDIQLHQLYFDKQAGKTAISFIAPEKGEFRLKLKSSGSSKSSGNYRLQLSQPRPADENDRLRIEAEKDLTGSAVEILNAKQRTKKVPNETRQERLATLQKLLTIWQKLGDAVFEQETLHQIGLVEKNPEIRKNTFEKLLQLARVNQDILDEAWALYHLGNSAENRGEIEMALKNFQTANELAAKSGAVVVEAEMLNRLANYYKQRDQYTQARDLLQKMISLYERLNSEVDVAKGRVSLAVVLKNIDPKYNVKTVYEELLKVFERNEAFYEKANVLRLLGSDAADKNQFTDAEKYLTDSLALMEKYGEASDEAWSLLGLGLIRFSEGKYAEATQFFNRALAKVESEPDSVIKIRANIGLARVEFSRNNLTGFLERLTTAEKIADTIKSVNEQIDIYLSLNALYMALGQNEKALEYSLKAKKIADEVKNKKYQVAVLTAIGRYYHFQGDFPQAIRNFDESIKISKEIDQSNVGLFSYQSLGMVYYDLGYLRRAEENYLKAIEILGKKAAVADKMLASLLSIELYLRQRDYPEARAELEELSKLMETTKNFALKGQMSLFSGFLALKEGRFPDASQNFSTALTLSSQPPNVVSIALALRGLGDALIGLRSFPEAEQVLGQTLGIFRRIGSPTGEADVFQALSKMENKRGNRKLAIFYGKQSVRLVQTIRGTIKPLDAEVRKNFLFDSRNYYRDLAINLIEENRLAEAQQIISLSKEEEFYQFTKQSPDSVANSPNQVDFNAEETEVAQKYKTLADRVSAITARASELSQRGILTTEEKAEMQKLQTELVTLNANFGKFPQELNASFGKSAMPVISTKQTSEWQKRLTEFGNDSILLTTLLTDDKYYIIVTTPDGQFFRKTEISKSELSKKIEDLQNVLSRPLATFSDPTEEVYRILIRPLEADLVKLNAKTLLWSLDGELRYVPLAALSDGQKFMVEKFTNVIVTLAQPPQDAQDIGLPAAKWRALGGGVSISINDFPRLPNVETELKNIIRDETSKNLKTEKGLFVGRRLLNQDFTRRNLADALKQKFQLVHLATHFSLKSGNEVDSSLLLGDGSKLTLAEMRTDSAFDLNDVELVTLSACETGSSKDDANGKEIESFGVIAQKRGAKAVIATLWKLPDNATPQLMTEFYRNYQSGQLSKAEALRQAQLVMLKGKKLPPKFSHPAYWASFVIIGEWR